MVAEQPQVSQHKKQEASKVMVKTCNVYLSPHLVNIFVTTEPLTNQALKKRKP